jgi:hypothetical protein
MVHHEDAQEFSPPDQRRMNARAYAVPVDQQPRKRRLKLLDVVLSDDPPFPFHFLIRSRSDVFCSGAIMPYLESAVSNRLRCEGAVSRRGSKLKKYSACTYLEKQICGDRLKG